MVNPIVKVIDDQGPKLGILFRYSLLTFRFITRISYLKIPLYYEDRLSLSLHDETRMDRSQIMKSDNKINPGFSIDILLHNSSAEKTDQMNMHNTNFVFSI